MDCQEIRLSAKDTFFAAASLWWSFHAKPREMVLLVIFTGFLFVYVIFGASYATPGAAFAYFCMVFMYQIAQMLVLFRLVVRQLRTLHPKLSPNKFQISDGLWKFSYGTREISQPLKEAKIIWMFGNYWFLQWNEEVILIIPKRLVSGELQKILENSVIRTPGIKINPYPLG